MPGLLLGFAQSSPPRPYLTKLGIFVCKRQSPNTARGGVGSHAMELTGFTAILLPAIICPEPERPTPVSQLSSNHEISLYIPSLHLFHLLIQPYLWTPAALHHALLIAYKCQFQIILHSQHPPCTTAQHSTGAAGPAVH